MAPTITATKTATERIVRVRLDDGSAREWRFGMIQGKDGKWALPDPAQVDREVQAFLAGIKAGSASEEPDPETTTAIAASTG